MGLWKEFKRAGREMYKIPDGVSAARFLSSLPKEYVEYVRGEAVSAAYQRRRTAGLQAVMDFQQMGGMSRKELCERRGEKLPRNYHLVRMAAHQALSDFPEIRDWIDENAIN